MTEESGSSSAPPDLTLSPEAAATIRAEIGRAGGREVSFLLGVNQARELVDPRAVSRGNRSAVLVAARDAPAGGLVLHNHPSGNLEPSEPDLAVAAALYERGLGSAIVDNEVGRLLEDLILQGGVDLSHVKWVNSSGLPDAADGSDTAVADINVRLRADRSHL